MKKIAILISGSGSNLEAIAKACFEQRIDGQIKCVISNDPSAFGIQRAKSFGLNTVIIDHSLFKTRDEFDNEIDHVLSKYKIDIVVLAGFMRILGKKITKKYYGKMINLHPSLLPLYPGLDTHAKVLQNRDKNHGISIHYVSSELDAGPIIAQGCISVNKNDTKNDLEKRIHSIEHKLFPKIINDICNEKIYLEDNIVKFSMDKSMQKIYEYYEE